MSRIIDAVKNKTVKLFYDVDNVLTGGLGTRSAINYFIKEYGKMLELKIDNREKKIFLNILLKGEDAPVAITVEQYELQRHENGEDAVIIVKQASSDRPWLDAALRNFVIEQEFKIPGKAAAMLNEFLA